MAPQVLDPVLNASSPCAGFPADTYDRYVLGLLDSSERANVDKELSQQCPVCTAGVQRSINLWLVFAGSLEQVEPSADFRARLIRIAEFSNRVLTVPKRYKRKPAILFSSLVVICLILAMLLFFTFLAGRQSSHLEMQSLKSELTNLRNESAENQVRLQEQSDKNKEIQEKLNRPSSLVASKQLQEQLSEAQAQVQSYRDSVKRDMQRTSDNSTLVSALENPGVKLLTFKTAEGGPSTAYAFVIENSRILFVASKMPQPTELHQYQLWLVRKTDHHFVSLGLFNSKSDGPEVLTYDQDKASIADLAGLLVTEEKIDGSTDPSDKRVLETPGAAAAIAIPVPTTPPSL